MMEDNTGKLIRDDSLQTKNKKWAIYKEHNVSPMEL